MAVLNWTFLKSSENVTTCRNGDIFSMFFPLCITLFLITHSAKAVSIAVRTAYDHLVDDLRLILFPSILPSTSLVPCLLVALHDQSISKCDPWFPLIDFFLHPLIIGLAGWFIGSQCCLRNSKDFANAIYQNFRCDFDPLFSLSMFRTHVAQWRISIPVPVGVLHFLWSLNHSHTFCKQVMAFRIICVRCFISDSESLSLLPTIYPR